MKIAVIGDTGFVGSAICSRLVSSGADVVGLSRSVLVSPAYRHVAADRADIDNVRSVLDEFQPSIVIDACAMTLNSTLPMLSLLNERAIRYVLLSSSDVYRNYGHLHNMEISETLTEVLSEDSPLRTKHYPYRLEKPRDAGSPDYWMDDYDKIPIEKAVADVMHDWTILRLPMVYGACDRQRRFRWAVRPMLAKQEKLIVPVKWAKWATTYGYVENTAAAIVHSVNLEKAGRQIFNIADHVAVTHNVWIERISAITGWSGDICLADDPATDLYKATAQLNLDAHLRISAEKIESMFEFSAPVTWESALEETICYLSGKG
jgi:nucleoside-diphosphate-sugar epimerase